MRSIVYHQAAGRCTLARDEIQPKGLMIYAALRASMICQACGLDKKSESFRFRIFGWDSWTRTSVVQESKSCAFTSLAISQRMLYDLAPSPTRCHYSILFILCQYFLSQKAYLSTMRSTAIGSVLSTVAIKSVHSALSVSEKRSSSPLTSSEAR